MYSRLRNPTRTSLEKQIAALEGGKYSFVTSSGMGAINLCFSSLLKSGDHVVCIDDIYGGTRELNDKVLEGLGIQFTYAELNDDDLGKYFKENTKMVYCESPTNPTLKCVDIKRIAEEAKKRKCIMVVDNTFMSPYLQNPLKLGADIVIHSCTKYMGGHADIVMGAIVCNNMEWYQRFFNVYKSLGANPSPFDCFLCQRGIKTLKVRMDEHCKNALAVAKFLEAHPKVEKVFYPGLESHPTRKNALKNANFDKHGGVVTIYLKADLAKCKKFLKSLKLITLAVSLGGVESLVESPALMTHTGVAKEAREKVGLFDNLIRFAIGIESIDDIIGDLKQALDQI